MEKYEKACAEQERSRREDEARREAAYRADVKEYQETCERRRQLSKQRTKGLDRELQGAQGEWRIKRARLVEQKQSVEKWLAQAYGLNIIPLPYRNLAAIAYIYDYLSSSRYETLENVLYHTHLEEGIVRMERGLDEVVRTVSRQIDETRRLREQNAAYAEQQLARETEMLESLARMETTTGDIARTTGDIARTNAEVYTAIRDLHIDLAAHDYGRSTNYYYYSS